MMVLLLATGISSDKYQHLEPLSPEADYLVSVGVLSGSVSLRVLSRAYRLPSSLEIHLLPLASAPWLFGSQGAFPTPLFTFAMQVSRDMTGGYDEFVKIGVLGPRRSGTTSFLFQWTSQFDHESYNQTRIDPVGASLETHAVRNDDGSLTVLIDFHRFCPYVQFCLSPLPQCQAIFFTFSSTNRASFVEMQHLYDHVDFYFDLHKKRPPRIAIVACMCDLDRAWNLQEARDFATNIEAFFFETSANWTYTTQEMFRTVLIDLGTADRSRS